MDQDKDKLAQKTVGDIKKEFIVVGKSRVHYWYMLFVIGILIGITAGISYVANRSGEFVESEAAGTKAYLPNGKLADLQISDEIILSKYWDRKTLIPSGAPLLPYSEAMAARVQIRKLPSIRTTAWNPNHKYKIRWDQRNGEALDFTGPTEFEFGGGKSSVYIGSGKDYAVGLVAAPDKCGTTGTLVAQLVFQNKNPDAKTFGQEYVLKESTRQIIGMPCPAR